MIVERIRQRRAQMLVHSFLYYKLDTSIVSDDTWQRWADELAQLQRAHPAPVQFFDREFADWDGSTGMHLPGDEWVRDRAHLVLRLHDSPGRARPAPAPAAPIGQQSLF